MSSFRVRLVPDKVLKTTNKENKKQNKEKKDFRVNFIGYGQRETVSVFQIPL